MATPRFPSVRIAAWTAILTLGAAQGWVFRHKVSPDGVAYLDLSDAIVRGHLAELVNAYWSPLYPTLVGLLRLGLGTSAYWEASMLHVASFVGLVLSLIAFERLLAALRASASPWDRRPFDSSLGLALTYVFFAIVSLTMISVEGTVPDFFLAAACYGAFACAVRVESQSPRLQDGALLGLFLALGALSKSFMFPMAAVILVVLAVRLSLRNRKALRSVGVAVATFAVVTLPWCIALSQAIGKPTTGETGRLNFAWYVNETQPYNTGVMPRLATATDLPVDGIAVMRNAQGTNPLWTDPARWNADLQATFSARRIWTRLRSGLDYYVGVFSPLILLGVAAAIAAGWRTLRITLERTAIVVIPCVAAFIAYALVYTTSRYVAPFLIAGFVALAAALPRDAHLRVSRFILALGVLLVALDASSPIRGRIFVAYVVAYFVVAFALLSKQTVTRRWYLSIAITLLTAAVATLLPALAVRILVLGGAVAAWIWVSQHETIPNGPLAGDPLLRAVAVAALLATAIPSAIGTYHAVRRWNAVRRGETHPDFALAQQFMKEGIAPGSKIAVIGDAVEVGWARVARYQIVAIVPAGKVAAFAALTESDRQRILRAFAQVGAVHVVVRPAS